MTKRATASMLDAAKESPQANAVRLVDLQLDKFKARSVQLRKALERHGSTLPAVERERITAWLDRNHELTLARVTRSSEIEDFEFLPRLDDGS